MSAATRFQVPHTLVASVLLCLGICCPPAIAQTYQELYAFSGQPDGAVPRGGLVEGRDGNFYGTTYYGGPWDCGTIFKIAPGGNLTIIAALDGTWGRYPCYALLQAGDGNFYGSTWRGDVFRVTTNGVLTYLGTGFPQAGELIQGSNGYIYGAHLANNTFYGFIYKEAPDWQSGQILFEFTWARSAQYGVYPESGLIQAKDGNLYGTTSGGGVSGWGTVYRMTPAGGLTTIASFNDGGYARYPYGRLMQARDGGLYGVAQDGKWGQGAVFKVTPAGILTTFHSFDFSDGQFPNGGLVEGNDGNFYGTARYGGFPGGLGTVFQLTPSGSSTTLVAFTGVGGRFSGANPYAGLVQGSDGNLYGTSGTQGSRGCGNVFRIIMPGPRLNYFRSGQEQVLSWRTNYSGFTLQSSVSLDPPSWLDISQVPVTSGGQFWVTNPISGPAQFFRLRK